MTNKEKARSAVQEGFGNTDEGQAFTAMIHARVDGAKALGLVSDGPSASRKHSATFNGGGM